MWLTRLWQTRKYFRIDIDLKRLIILSIISVLFIFTYYSNNKIVEIVIMILSVIIFVVFNKSLISKAFEFAKNKIRK